MVVHDYMVAYEGKCDPSLHSCFAACKNDSCVDVAYPYTKMQKNANNLYAECGKDITNCDNANICLPQDGKKCSITYCDPTVSKDTCDTTIGGSSTTMPDIAP